MDNTQKFVTEEDITKLKDLINRDNAYLHAHGFQKFIFEEAEPIVDRMWDELQNLRELLRKQIY